VVYVEDSTFSSSSRPSVLTLAVLCQIDIASIARVANGTDDPVSPLDPAEACRPRLGLIYTSVVDSLRRRSP
jgi:hypothetical protein